MPTVTQSPDLGNEIKDLITGATGIVIEITLSLTNSPKVLVQPQRIDENGSPALPFFVSMDHIVYVSEGIGPMLPVRHNDEEDTDSDDDFEEVSEDEDEDEEVAMKFPSSTKRMTRQ